MNPQLEAKVYSIWPEELIVQRAWQRYVIPPGSPEKPSELLVTRMLTAKNYVGNQRYEDHYDDAIIIAQDIANSVCNVTGAKDGEASFGVWVSTDDGPIPPEILRRKIEERDALMRYWLRDGDKLFEDGKQSQIHRLSRMACDILQENRIWHRKAASGSVRTCPFCGSNIPAGVSLCMACGRVIDQELYNLTEELIKVKAQTAAAPPPKPVAAVRVPAGTSA